MRFTKRQYEIAIQSLKEASEQLEPDGHCCACCGDSGHQAFECGHNPLFAMAVCSDLVNEAREFRPKIKFLPQVEAKKKLKELIDWTAGNQFRMGEQVGPAKVHLPEES